jgi:hypothetical protein
MGIIVGVLDFESEIEKRLESTKPPAGYDNPYE